MQTKITDRGTGTPKDNTAQFSADLKIQKRHELPNRSGFADLCAYIQIFTFEKLKN